MGSIPTVADLVAGIIDRVKDRPVGARRPPMPIIEVIEALRFLLRDGVQRRELRVAGGRASCLTFRRLDEWHRTALLRRVHALLACMARSGPDAAAWDVVVDDSSVRGKRGGPKPTGRIRCPTLIVWGDQDAFLDRSLAEAAAALCDDVQVVHLEQASHWVQHEEAETVNRLLADFLVHGTTDNRMRKPICDRT